MSLNKNKSAKQSFEKFQIDVPNQTTDHWSLSHNILFLTAVRIDMQEKIFKIMKKLPSVRIGEKFRDFISLIEFMLFSLSDSDNLYFNELTLSKRIFEAVRHEMRLSERKKVYKQSFKIIPMVKDEITVSFSANMDFQKSQGYKNLRIDIESIINQSSAKEKTKVLTRGGMISSFGTSENGGIFFTSSEVPSFNGNIERTPTNTIGAVVQSSNDFILPGSSDEELLDDTINSEPLKFMDEAEKKILVGDEASKFRMVWGLLHCLTCVSCESPACKEVKIDVLHSRSCSILGCGMRNCEKFRFILSHYNECLNKECNVCVSVHKKKLYHSLNNIPDDFKIKVPKICDFCTKKQQYSNAIPSTLSLSTISPTSSISTHTPTPRVRSRSRPTPTPTHTPTHTPLYEIRPLGQSYEPFRLPWLKKAESYKRTHDDEIEKSKRTRVEEEDDHNALPELEE